MNLLLSSDIVVDNSFDEPNIYLDYLYISESYIASKLAKMALNEDFKILFNIDKEVKKSIENQSIKLSEIQIDAIKSCFEENISIITGGPGTGKTTIINTISKIFIENGYNISLCAPTGRAAKRIEETTGIEAKTIHRMLGYIPSSYDDIGHFEYNEDNPLDTDLIIIDEMSMVDVVLFEEYQRETTLQRSLSKTIDNYSSYLFMMGFFESFSYKLLKDFDHIAIRDNREDKPKELSVFYKITDFNKISQKLTKHLSLFVELYENENFLFKDGTFANVDEGNVLFSLYEESVLDFVSNHKESSIQNGKDGKTVIFVKGDRYFWKQNL